MSLAQDIIKEVDAAGGAIVLIGDGVKLESDKGPLPDELIARARANKAGILRALQHPKEPSAWNDNDWRAYFGERAAIREHDAGVPKEDAERLAYEDCISQWLALNLPPPCPQDTCAHCSKPRGDVGTDSVAVLAGRPNEHLWLHHGCHRPFISARRGQAVESLPDFDGQRR